MTQQQRDESVELSVVVPCFNEADNVSEVVARTLRVFRDRDICGEIVLVDDGSEDDTRAAIAEQIRKHGASVVERSHGTNLGIEAGWRTGLVASRGELVCLMDADLQNQPEDIYRLYREARTTNADLVQGTRSHIGRSQDHRRLVSVALNGLLNLCFGMRARDNKSGFVLCRRDVLSEILRHRHRYRYFQTFIGVAAHARGFKIREVETLFERRIYGNSFMGSFPLGIILLCLVDIAKALHEYRFTGYRDRLIEHFVAERLPPSAPPPPMRGLRRAWFKLYMQLMPLHHWMIRREAGYYYEILDRSQWLPADAVRLLQETKLRRLVHHAYRHVPYYRDAMDGLGIDPESIRTLDDLRRLPLLNKQTVRERLHFDLMSDNHCKKEVHRIVTSGSTGQPLTCWVDRHQLEQRWATTLRSHQWTGYRFGDPTVRLWHQTIGMDRLQVLKERLDAWLSRRRLVPAFEFHVDGVREMERVIRRHRPVLVEGYAESFHYLARSGADSNFSGLGIRGVVSSAQTLDDESRSTIERSFGTHVFDKYGAREFSGIAYECEQHEGRHVAAESYIVEILVGGRPALPGELGEVVITDLNNHVMPFLRYQIGDLAYAVDNDRPCPCGRGLPRIGPIEGRVQSMIVGASGGAMPSSFFYHVLKDYGYAISRFQIEQQKPGEMTFRYIPAARFRESVLEEICSHFRRQMGSDMRIVTEATDRIEMVRTGKHQAVINRAPLNYQEMGNVLDPRINADR